MSKYFSRCSSLDKRHPPDFERSQQKIRREFAQLFRGYDASPQRHEFSPRGYFSSLMAGGVRSQDRRGPIKNRRTLFSNDTRLPLQSASRGLLLGIKRLPPLAVSRATQRDRDARLSSPPGPVPARVCPADAALQSKLTRD